ncbi:hypothetical protein ACRAWF_22270 [Streptomyces sp. L7]
MEQVRARSPCSLRRGRAGPRRWRNCYRPGADVPYGYGVSHAFPLSPLMDPMLADLAGRVAGRLTYGTPTVPGAVRVRPELPTAGEERSGRPRPCWVRAPVRPMRTRGRRPLAGARRAGDRVRRGRPGRTSHRPGRRGRQGTPPRRDGPAGQRRAADAVRRARPTPRTRRAVGLAPGLRGSGAGGSTVCRPILPAAALLAARHRERRVRRFRAPARDAGGAVPATERLLCGGRLSGAAQPWLRDHVVGGHTLVPGAAFADLVLHAGDLCGLAVLEELALLNPLFLPDDDEEGVQVQVVLGEPDDSGRRAVDV